MHLILPNGMNYFASRDINALSTMSDEMMLTLQVISSKFDDFVSTSPPAPADASSVSEGNTSGTASLADRDDESETSDSAGDDECRRHE